MLEMLESGHALTSKHEVLDPVPRQDPAAGRQH